MIKKHQKKISHTLVAVFFFVLGFGAHAIFFPYLLPETILDDKAKATSQNLSPASDQETNKSLTVVNYRDGEFSPKVAQMKRSYYLSIINTSSNELMWLTSDNPLFQTSRGYGMSEELRTIIYEPGVYTISSKLHPDKKLSVIVK